jgi:subtilisin family serine protease
MRNWAADPHRNTSGSLRPTASVRSRVSVRFVGVLALLLTGLLPATPVTSSSAHERYVVVFRPGSDAPSISRILAGPEDHVVEVISHTLPGAIVEMSPRRAQVWAGHRLVERIEPEVALSISTTQSSPPWGLDRIDQVALPLDGRYAAPSAATGVRAYVVDSGIVASHPDFGGRVLSGFTAINDGRSTTDCNGHGTHVASVIGGKTYGVAKGISLIPVRVTDCDGFGTSTGLISGLEWILRQHVSGQPAVINISLAGTGSNAMDTAVNAVIAAGITVVVAAGNNGRDACTLSPARVPQALTVGSVNNSDSRATSSNFGTCLDLFAPGTSIPGASKNGGHTTASGTSLAAPHVAGIAALAMAITGTNSPAAIHREVVNSAVANRLTNIGSGSPNRLAHTASLSPATPASSTIDVLVPLSSGTAQIRFSGLSATPVVQLSEQPFAPGDLGRGLALSSGFINLSHSGGSFSSAEVCVPGGAKSRLIQFPSRGGRTDITSRVDTAAGRVCGKTSALSSYAAADLATERLAGSDRYSTAVAVSRYQLGGAVGPDSPLVFLATGENPADALAAGAAAASRNGVVLLTQRDRLPQATRAELQRRRPSQVVLVGGVSAISESVLNELRAVLPNAAVSRSFGSSRYETAVVLSQQSFPAGAPVVFVATGLGYADALAGSAAAGREGGPVLLVPGLATAAPPSVINELRRLAPSRVVVLGGTSAISAAIESGIRSALTGTQVDRVAGVDRYDTAARIAQPCTNTGVSIETLFVATGLGYADALAAAAIAGAGGCPLLITRPDQLPAPIRTAIGQLQPGRILVLGGSAAIGPQVELNLAGYL